MGVPDLGRWVEHDTSALLPPAVAELAILRPPERGVEAANRSKAIDGQREVVRREELRPLGIGVVVTVNRVGDELARGGAEVAGQRVHGGSADHGLRIQGQRVGQGGEPARCRSAVVVGEGEIVSARELGTGVSCRGGPGIRLPNRVRVRSSRNGATTASSGDSLPSSTTITS